MSETERQDLLDARRRWIKAVNARDLDGYAGLLAEDGIWMPPGQDAIKGRAAFRDWLAPFFERFEYRFELAPPVLKLAGPIAAERGVFKTVMRPVEGGDEMSHEGPYLVLWRREGEDWLIERYVDLSDLAG